MKDVAAATGSDGAAVVRAVALNMDDVGRCAGGDIRGGEERGWRQLGVIV